MKGRWEKTRRVKGASCAVAQRQETVCAVWWELRVVPYLGSTGWGVRWGPHLTQRYAYTRKTFDQFQHLHFFCEPNLETQ